MMASTLLSRLAWASFRRNTKLGCRSTLRVPITTLRSSRAWSSARALPASMRSGSASCAPLLKKLQAARVRVPICPSTSSPGLRRKSSARAHWTAVVKLASHWAVGRASRTCARMLRASTRSIGHSLWGPPSARSVISRFAGRTVCPSLLRQRRIRPWSVVDHEIALEDASAPQGHPEAAGSVGAHGLPLVAIGQPPVRHLGVAHSDFDALVVDRPLRVLVIPQEPILHAMLDHPNLAAEVGELVALVPEPRVHERRVQRESLRDVTPLEANGILAGVLLTLVQIGAALANREEELEVVEVPVALGGLIGRDREVGQRDLRPGVAEKEALDVLVALEAVDDAAAPRMRPVNVGPEAPLLVRIVLADPGLGARHHVGVVLLHEAVAEAPGELLGDPVRAIVAPDQAQAALHGEGARGRGIAQAVDVIRLLQLEVVAHPFVLEDIRVVRVQPVGQEVLDGVRDAPEIDALMRRAHGHEPVDPVLRVLLVLLCHEVLDERTAHQPPHGVREEDHLEVAVALSEVDPCLLEPLWNGLADERAQVLRVILDLADRVAEHVLVVEPRYPEAAGGIGMEDLDAAVDGVRVAVVPDLHEADELPLEDVDLEVLRRRCLPFLHGRGGEPVVGVVERLLPLGRAHGIPAHVHDGIEGLLDLESPYAHRRASSGASYVPTASPVSTSPAD